MAPLVLVIIVIFKSNIASSLTKISQYVSRVVKKRTDEKHEIKDVPPPNKKSFLAKIKLIVYFYQLQSMFQVKTSSTPSESSHSQSMLGSIFSINVLEIDGTDFQFCLPADYSFAKKKGINIWLMMSPIIFCTITYIVINLLNKCITSHKILKNSLQVSVFQIIQIVYIPVATSLFQLVSCVWIKDNGNDKNVLLHQGTIECYSWWQNCVIFYICISIVPYFASLYFGTLALRQKNLKQFYLMQVLPLTTVFFWIQRFTGYGKIENTNEYKKRGNLNVLSKPDTAVAEIEKTMEDFENVENVRPEMFDAEKKETEIGDPSYVLLQMIQLPYTCEYWPSIQLLRNLLVVAINIFIDQVRERLVITLLVIFVYIILLGKEKPFKDRAMNWLETTCMSCLLFLVVIGIIETSLLFPNTDNIEAFIQTLHTISMLVLFLPVALCCILTLADKFQEKRINQRKSS